MTGADSPVIADSSTEAMPSITVPSPGITSPASTTTRSPRGSSDAATLAAVGQPRGGLGAHRAQRGGLGAAAALGQRLGEVGEDDRQPQPDRDREGEPARVAAELADDQHAIVVISRADLDHEHDRVAHLDARVELLERRPDRRPQDVRREQRLRAAAACGDAARGGLRWRSSVQCLVELGGVHARLAEQAEEAPVGVVVDELLHALEREAADRARRGAPGSRRCPRRCAGRRRSRRSSRRPSGRGVGQARVVGPLSAR